jgi:glycosyltransferase involved in cell wall biosynthesis
MPPGELARRLEHAAVAAVPLPDNLYSRAFTSPLKIFEAMAAGIPVVASDLPAIREVIRDGESGILVAPGDPAALAEGLGRVLADPALAEAIAGRAREDVAACSWDRRAERIRVLVEGLR